MYNLDICYFRMITISKFMGRIFAKLKNIVHNNSRETIFNFISLTLIWVGFLGVHFKVGGEGITPPSV